MIPADLDVFTARLIALQELLDGPALSETRLVLYFDALADLPLDDVLGALTAAARTATFLPKPVELRRLAQGDTEDAVERAWLVFQALMRRAGAYASVATLDIALGETIRAMFGGWPQACRADYTPEMWAAKRKEFGRVYHVSAQRVEPGQRARYLAGLIEEASGGNPAWTKYAQLAVVDGAGHIVTLTGEAAEDCRLALAAGTPALNPLVARLLVAENL